MRKPTSKKLTCLALSLLMALGTAQTAVMAAGEDTAATTNTNTKTTLQEISESLSSISYAAYKEQHADAKRGTKSVTIDATDYVAESTTATVSVESNYNGKSGQSLVMQDDGKVTWKVNIPETGLYAIGIDYTSTSNKTNSIERMLYINDKVPFSEARYLLMKKTWINDYTDGRFEIDSNGNELRPNSHVEHVWSNYEFIDSNGYYANPFEFYLEAGENTITLESVREPMAIQTITIHPYEDKPVYEDYISGKSEATASRSTSTRKRRLLPPTTPYTRSTTGNPPSPSRSITPRSC